MIRQSRSSSCWILALVSSTVTSVVVFHLSDLTTTTHGFRFSSSVPPTTRDPARCRQGLSTLESRTRTTPSSVKVTFLSSPPVRRGGGGNTLFEPPCILTELTAMKKQGGGGSKEEDDFSFGQRIESVKAAVVGALSGGIALAPISAFHDILLGGDYITNGPAQWEFDTDMGSLSAALFAIVYRYCIRMDDNPMLNQGVIGAFVLTRTLSKIQVPDYCTFSPLTCDDHFGYFDWGIISQGLIGAAESAALYGVAALAMDYCIRRGIISKFRG